MRLAAHSLVNGWKAGEAREEYMGGEGKLMEARPGKGEEGKPPTAGEESMKALPVDGITGLGLGLGAGVGAGRTRRGKEEGAGERR